MKPQVRRGNKYRTKKASYKPSVEVITEPSSQKNGYKQVSYKKKKLLGKGGFGSVYAVIELATKKKYALKLVKKKGLSKKAREKLSSEIKIHSSLDHQYVCKYHKFFEDREHVYMLLDLCGCDTLMDVLNSKKRLSNRETKYFMYQLIEGMTHLASKRIIHRDLKLDDQLNVKIGDFGLAAQLAYDGQRKRTLCGTPNYIAPEILMNAQNGHSYEVDVWSIGVILFTLATGKPPFETRTLKGTYQQIKRIKYRFPAHITVHKDLKQIIGDIFQRDPFRRPTVFELLDYPYFKEYKQPQDCLLQVPKSLHAFVYRKTFKYPLPKKTLSEREGERYEKSKKNGVRPIDHFLKNEGCGIQEVPMTPKLKQRKKKVANPLGCAAVNRPQPCKMKPLVKTKPRIGRKGEAKENPNGYNGWLYKKLEKSLMMINKNNKYIQPKQVIKNRYEEEIKNKMNLEVKKQKDESTAPKVWVQDIADYSSKYGLAYRFNTGIVGAFYNDFTMMLYNPSTGKVTYFFTLEDDSNTQRRSHQKKKKQNFQKEEYNADMEFPSKMKKKITLIKYFHLYFEKTKGAMLVMGDEEEVFVKMYLRTNDAIVFRLSNRIVQVRFKDNSEIILSSEAKMVTYVSKFGIRKTFPLESILENNNDPSISKRLRYTKNVLFKLIKK